MLPCHTAATPPHIIIRLQEIRRHNTLPLERLPQGCFAIIVTTAVLSARRDTYDAASALPAIIYDAIDNIRWVDSRCRLCHYRLDTPIYTRRWPLQSLRIRHITPTIPFRHDIAGDDNIIVYADITAATLLRYADDYYASALRYASYDYIRRYATYTPLR